MDEGAGVGVGPAERAPYAGGDGPTPTRRRRMSASRKREAVLRLLRGEDLELVSRGLGVTAAELSGWREAFLAGGEASLRGSATSSRWSCRLVSAGSCTSTMSGKSFSSSLKRKEFPRS